MAVYTMLMTLLSGSNLDFETFWTQSATVNTPQVSNGSEGIYLRNVVMNGDSRTFVHTEWTQKSFEEIAILGVNLNGDILWSTEFAFTGTTSALSSWISLTTFVFSSADPPWDQTVVTNLQNYRLRFGPSSNDSDSWFAISTPSYSNGTRIFAARKTNQAFAFPKIKHGHQGCWAHANLLQYTYGYTDGANNDPDMCISYCRNANPEYNIAMLVEQRQCHCAVYNETTPPTVESPSLCDMSCPGDNYVKCGGWMSPNLGTAYFIPGVPGHLHEVLIFNRTITTSASSHLLDLEDNDLTGEDPLYISGVSINTSSSPSITYTLHYSTDKCNSVITMTSLPCDTPQVYPANGDNVDVGIILVMCLKIVFSQTPANNIQLQLFAPEDANYIAVPAVVVAGKNTETVSETTTTPTTTTPTTTTTTPTTTTTSTTTTTPTTTTTMPTTTTTSTTSTTPTPTTTTTTPTPTTTTPTSTAASGTSPTTAGSASSTSASKCLCPCSGVVQQANLTSTELKAKVEEIQKRLAVNVSELSSTIRRRTSAKDKRVSAVSIGYVGIALIVSVFGSVLFIDSAMLLRDIRLLFRNLKEGCCRFSGVSS